MSKAFTSEDIPVPDIQPEAPRLAPGEVRYVTPEGHRALHDELAALPPSSRRAQALAAILPQLTVHAFYVKYLLPIYFDVQCMERP